MFHCNTESTKRVLYITIINVTLQDLSSSYCELLIVVNGFLRKCRLCVALTTASKMHVKRLQKNRYNMINSSNYMYTI